MKYIAQTVCIICIFLSSTLCASSFELSQKTKVIFADTEQGRNALGRVDEFVSRLSPFDRAARMQTDKVVDTNDYLQFVKSHVVAWPESDIDRVTAQLQTIKAAFSSYNLSLPNTVLLIKTTGKEEGNAAYTRENVIVLNDRFIKGQPNQLLMVLFHELFHVISRADPKKKEQLYKVIGFFKANELNFPKDLATRKLTNPDAPLNNYFMKVNHQGQAINIMPILYGLEGGYDVKKGGGFFRQMYFKLLAVSKNNQTDALTAVCDDGEPVLFEPSEVKGFLAGIGNNTGYIIHPEEVLASNFALLMMGKEKVPNPEILIAMKSILQGK